MHPSKVCSCSIYSAYVPPYSTCTAFVPWKSCTGLIKGGPYHGGVQTIMCCNNTWPIVVTHLTHRDVDHWWQSPLQSAFLCLCTHLLQRCLGIFLSTRLRGEPPGCLPYMLRCRCSFAQQGFFILQPQQISWLFTVHFLRVTSCSTPLPPSEYRF